MALDDAEVRVDVAEGRVVALDDAEVRVEELYVDVEEMWRSCMAI